MNSEYYSYLPINQKSIIKKIKKKVEKAYFRVYSKNIVSYFKITDFGLAHHLSN